MQRNAQQSSINDKALFLAVAAELTPKDTADMVLPSEADRQSLPLTSSSTKQVGLSQARVQ